MTVIIKLINVSGTEEFIALGPADAKQTLQQNIRIYHKGELYIVRGTIEQDDNTIISCVQKQD